MTVFARPFGPVFSQTMFDTQLAAFRPSFSVDFTREELPDNFTFTRASSATDGSSGTLLTFGNNAYRRSDQKGLLLEGARTNLVTDSEVLAVGGGTTVTDNNVTAPNGTLKADTLTATATTGTHDGVFGSSITVVSGTTYTHSVFAKAGTHNFIQIAALSAAYGNNAWANFNISSGAVGSVGSATTARITTLSNGWYRCEATFPATANSASGRVSYLIISSATAGRFESWTTAGTESVALWGGQSEAGAFASSYIPTTGTAATRAADSALNSVLASIGFNAVEGTILAEFEYMGASPSATVYSFGAAGVNDITLRRGFGTPSTLGALVNVSSVLQTTGLEETITATQIGKHAFAYKQNDFAISLNGLAVKADTSGNLPTVSTLYIGSSSAGNQMFGWLRRLTYWPTRFPDAQLPTISAL